MTITGMQTPLLVRPLTDAEREVLSRHVTSLDSRNSATSSSTTDILTSVVKRTTEHQRYVTLLTWLLQNRFSRLST